MGLDSQGRLVAPRDEPFVLEVRSDLPRVERRGDRWLVLGRGEPLDPEAQARVTRRAPAEVAVRERVEGQGRATAS